MSQARHEREGRPWTRPDNLTDEARARGRENAGKALAREAYDRAADVLPTIEEIRAEGATSMAEIARALNSRGVGRRVYLSAKATASSKRPKSSGSVSLSRFSSPCCFTLVKSARLSWNNACDILWWPLPC